jgi:hypothetical protein
MLLNFRSLLKMKDIKAKQWKWECSKAGFASSGVLTRTYRMSSSLMIGKLNQHKDVVLHVRKI